MGAPTTLRWCWLASMNDMESVRARLSADRAEVVARLRELDATFTDIVDAARDSNLDDEHDPEGATIAADRSMVSALAHAARQQLAEIDAALARVAASTYGTCQQCGAPISDGRLEARPATALCINCARR